MQSSKPRELRKIERIKPIKEAQRIIDSKQKREPFWLVFGTYGRFKKIFVEKLDLKPIKFLLSLKKPKPNILFLGAGRGEYILAFNEFVSNLKLQPEYDVLSLTKQLTKEVQQIVRTDFSDNFALENIIANPKKYASLIEQIKGKYDLIIAAMSIGAHTDWPDRNSFASALMLAQKGEAYIQIELNFKPNLNPKFSFDSIKRFILLATKAYNKKNNTDLQFTIDLVPGTNFMCIKRIK